MKKNIFFSLLCVSALCLANEASEPVQQESASKAPLVFEFNVELQGAVSSEWKSLLQKLQDFSQTASQDVKSLVSLLLTMCDRVHNQDVTHGQITVSLSTGNEVTRKCCCNTNNSSCCNKCDKCDKCGCRVLLQLDDTVAQSVLESLTDLSETSEDKAIDKTVVVLQAIEQSEAAVAIDAIVVNTEESEAEVATEVVEAVVEAATETTEDVVAVSEEAPVVEEVVAVVVEAEEAPSAE